MTPLPPAVCVVQPPNAAPLAAGAGPLEARSSFLFEHCTGLVVFVSTPTGRIQIDGAPDDAPPIPYHYSDVWDDGKCVKQFPRVGDTVSCYIGIDPKTKKEKVSAPGPRVWAGGGGELARPPPPPPPCARMILYDLVTF